MSEISSANLLRLLGSGIAPTDSRHAAPPESADFSRLLSKARAGDVSSGLTVTADPSLNLEFTPEKTEALSRIADMAQALDAQRVLIQDGSDQYILDVERRCIIGKVDPSKSPLLTGIDAVARLDAAMPPADGSSASADQLLRALSSFDNAA